MTTELTPPAALFAEWLADGRKQYDDPALVAGFVAEKAARWGADIELAECCKFMEWQKLAQHERLTDYLRAVRRPKQLND